jgi:hypothetical protein
MKGQDLLDRQGTRWMNPVLFVHDHDFDVQLHGQATKSFRRSPLVISFVLGNGSLFNTSESNLQIFPT